MYPETRGVAVGIDARDYVNEAAAGAYVAASRALLPEIHVHHVDDIHLENYQAARQTTTTQLRYEPTPPPPPPPVNFATIVEHAEPYKELMSLTSLQESRRDECATTILCAAHVETCLAMPDVTLAVQQQPQSQQQQPQPVATTIETESLLLKKPSVILVAPDIANTMERKQPDGEDVLRQLEMETEDPADATLSTSGMLDRISHDLDYLLNRTKEDA